MLNSIHERGMNKYENIKVKVQKYPATSSIDILDHIKPSLLKAPEQIIIHACTNDISNNTSFLKNVKKIVKFVKETCKDTKHSFSLVICRTNIKDITDCRQQNVGFINNGNIKKSDLNSKGWQLLERDSSYLGKNLLDLTYLICKPGRRSVPYEPEVSDNCVNKTLRYFKTNHPQYVSLGY